MELMQASFEGTFPDFPLPNPASGLSRIHVVTFHFFNSFNTASYDLRNSQCKFWVKTVEGLKRYKGLAADTHSTLRDEP
jgi:hypothetical protein